MDKNKQEILRMIEINAKVQHQNADLIHTRMDELHEQMGELMKAMGKKSMAPIKEVDLLDNLKTKLN